MGTELGRTLSAKEPKCVGEVLRFVNEGRGGCKTTQTCCCPPPGGEEMLLLLLFWLEGKLRSPSGLSWLSILSTLLGNSIARLLSSETVFSCSGFTLGMLLTGN